MECQRCTKCGEVCAWPQREEFLCLAKADGDVCHGTDVEMVDQVVIDKRSLLAVAKEHSTWFYRTVRFHWDQHAEEWIDLKHSAGVESTATPPGNIVMQDTAVRGVEQIRHHYEGLRAWSLMHRYRAVSLRLFGALEFVCLGSAVVVTHESSLGLAVPLLLFVLAWTCDGVRSKNRHWKTRWN